MHSLSVVAWTLIQPQNLAFIGAILAAILLWTRHWRLGRNLLAIVLAACLAVAVVPIGAWLVEPLEVRFPPPVSFPDRVNGMVILGGGIDADVGDTPGRFGLTPSGERLVAALALALKHPDLPIVYCGGNGALTSQRKPEAIAAARFFAAFGIDPARIRTETQSRDTFENLRNCQALVQPMAGQVWLLITSAAHMPRAMGVARALGWDMLAYPVDYVTDGRFDFELGFEPQDNLMMMSRGLKEWIGLLAYRLRGRTATLFPAP